jgi:hypothetical protein
MAGLQMSTEGVDVKTRVPVRWHVDLQYRHILVLEHREMIGCLFDRNGWPFILGYGHLREQAGECGTRNCVEGSQCMSSGMALAPAGARILYEPSFVPAGSGIRANQFILLGSESG